MAVGLIEHTILSNLRREYEAQGYDFYENPPRTAVPAFLGGFHPDAIAVRGGEGYVIALKSRKSKASSLNHIAERFSGQSRWAFRVFLYDENKREDVPAKSIDLGDIRARVIRLRDQDESEAALLLGWAMLEAVFRAKSDSTALQTSVKIAERLEHLGIIIGEQADRLRQSATIRNAVAHGRFEIRPGTGLIDVTLDAAEMLNQRKTRLPDT